MRIPDYYLLYVLYINIYMYIRGREIIPVRFSVSPAYHYIQKQHPCCRTSLSINSDGKEKKRADERKEEKEGKEILCGP